MRWKTVPSITSLERKFKRNKIIWTKQWRLSLWQWTYLEWRDQVHHSMKNIYVVVFISLLDSLWYSFRINVIFYAFSQEIYLSVKWSFLSIQISCIVLDSSMQKPPKFPVTLGNRVVVYLELADIQRKLNLTVDTLFCYLLSSWFVECYCLYWISC